MTGFQLWTGEGSRSRGEFRAQALWIARRLKAPRKLIASGLGAEKPEEDPRLGQMLDAIVDEVQRRAAGAREGVTLEYAAKIEHACKHLPRHQVAGAVRSFKEAQAAALAHIAREEAAEIALRREAMVRAHRGKHPRQLSKPRGPAPEGSTPG